MSTNQKSTLRYKLHSGKNSKAGYFLGAGFRDLLPDALWRSRLRSTLDEGLRRYGDVSDRVDYYCKLTGTEGGLWSAGFPARHEGKQGSAERETGNSAQDDAANAQHSSLSIQHSEIGTLRRKDSRSTYYFDSRDLLRYFPPQLTWAHVFGDVISTPPIPAIVKSRPLGCDNANSVLLKLNRCLHYVFVRDRLSLADKRPTVLFRGHIGTRENRRRFCDMYANNPRVDLADTRASYGQQSEYTKPKLSIYEQLRYRYIMALEGNDVATNLKWIMGSHSVAVMPRPTCETWFMEGRLLPGVHYIEVRPDFADLLEKIDHYEAHPAEAEAIVRAANAHVAQFLDRRRERYIGLRVLEKYFTLTNPGFSL